MAQFIDPFPGMTPDRRISKPELARALRQALAAEEEAIHLYEAIADATNNERVSKVLRNVADEERVHVGELQQLLEEILPDEKKLIEEGKEEVKKAWVLRNCKLAQSVETKPEPPKTKQPQEMTEDEFIDYHKTGTIPMNAYDRYDTSEGISFVKKDHYPILLKTLMLKNQPVEIRQFTIPAKYVKWAPKTFKDKRGEYVAEDIVRDEKGDPIYMTDEEATAAGRATKEIGLAAFVGDRPIGFASNEFGTAGVWVVGEFQKQGLGTLLLKEFMRLNPNIKRIGQMTPAGEKLTRSLHREYVKEPSGRPSEGAV
jgi:rubrerythrin